MAELTAFLRGARIADEVLALRPDYRALLVVADGPATLTVKAPGHLQPDAAPFAEQLATALADADTAALAALDPATCDRLWMRGRPALQVLAHRGLIKDYVRPPLDLPTPGQKARIIAALEMFES